MWIVDNSIKVLEKLREFNGKNLAKDIGTYDFSNFIHFHSTQRLKRTRLLGLSVSASMAMLDGSFMWMNAEERLVGDKLVGKEMAMFGVNRT